MAGRDALHPQARALVERDAARAQGGAAPAEPTIAQFRAAAHEYVALGPDPVDLAEVRDLALGAVPGRLYRPAAEEPLPVLVYCHGGGGLRGDLDTHDRLCRALAAAAGCLLLAADYPLAPEHRFPAGLEAAHAATGWAAEHAAGLGGDPDRLAVGGDSTGATIAAGVALLARDRRGPPLRCQLLLYPPLDATLSSPSMEAFAEGFHLTRRTMAWCWEQYLPPGVPRTDPLASPLHAEDLAGLPPALVITAGCDPLRDEAEAYAQRLAAADVRVRARRYEGMIHSFMLMGGVLDDGARAIAEVGAALREELGVAHPARS